MKINKTHILSLLLLFTFLGCNSFAIVDKADKNDKTGKSLKTERTIKIMGADKKTKTEKAAKKAKEDEETFAKITFDNNVHSVFLLKDCLDIAAANNPKIQSALYNEIAYKTKIGQAWSNYFPKLSGGIEGAYAHTSAEQDDVRLTENSKGLTAGVTGKMTIFDFGKTKAEADSAKRNYEAKHEITQENINTVIYEIKSTYYNVLFAQAQIKVYQDTVKDFELQLKQATGFYKIGKKAKIDVVIAEYNLGKAKLDLVKAKNQLEIANAELAQIMGIPEYTNFELGEELSLKKYEISIEDAVNKAFEVRPELLAAQKTLEAAKMDVRAKQRTYAPELGVFAGYNYGSEYKLSSGNAGVGLTYNDLNIMKLKKQIDEAKALYKKSKADYEDVKHTVYLNVKKGHIDLETASESISIAILSLAEAKEQYRQVTGRYKAGVGDAIELKDGENTYLNARLDFYNTLLDYNVSAARLEKEIGVPLSPSDKFVIEPDKIKIYK